MNETHKKEERPKETRIEVPTEVLKQIAFFYKATLIASVLIIVACLSSESDKVNKMYESVRHLNNILSKDGKILHDYLTLKNEEREKFETGVELKLSKLIIKSNEKTGLIKQANGIDIIRAVCEEQKNNTLDTLINCLIKSEAIGDKIEQLYDTSNSYHTSKYIDTVVLKDYLTTNLCDNPRHKSAGKYYTLLGIRKVPISEVDQGLELSLTRRCVKTTTSKKTGNAESFIYLDTLCLNPRFPHKQRTFANANFEDYLKNRDSLTKEPKYKH
ncbi:hypothetical protein WDZ92_09010, partial [Nostoc sp. NIES-2111]